MRVRTALMLSALCVWLSFGCSAPGAEQPVAKNSPPAEEVTVMQSVGAAANPAPTPAPTAAPTPEADPNEVSLSLRFVGDLMCCTYQMEGAKTGDTYDFNPPFEAIREDLLGADLLCGNFETNIVPSEPLCGDMKGFNAPTEYLDAVKNCGFDVLFTANNHALDYGVAGAITTLDAIEAAGVTAVGTNRAPEDAKKIAIREIKGLKLAVLAYADRTNKKKVELDGEEAYWAFNYFTQERLKQDVALAREQGAELILMYLHEGREKLTEPNKYQIRDADWAFEEGVDLVIMSHTHSLLTMERREIATERGVKQVFCAYGLGNFMSSAIHDEALNNLIVNLDVTYDRTLGGLKALDASYELTYTYNYYDENGLRQFRIVPMEKTLEDFSLINPRATLSERRLYKAYSDMRKRMDTYGAATSVKTLSREGGA